MDELDQNLHEHLAARCSCKFEKLQRPALFHHLQHLLEFKNLKNIV